MDGKVLRGSVDRYEGQDAIKMISACAVESGLVLAQQAVPDDTNEIGALPELLKLLGSCLKTQKSPRKPQKGDPKKRDW